MDSFAIVVGLVHSCGMQRFSAPASEVWPHSESTRQVWKEVPGAQVLGLAAIEHATAAWTAMPLIDWQQTAPLQSLASLHAMVTPPLQAVLAGLHTSVTPASFFV
jgi:hypothetical protein